MYSPQKAKGLGLASLVQDKLWQLRVSVPSFDVFKATEAILLTEGRLKETIKKLTFVTPPEALMVRPAPVRPRHGFVESERVSATEGRLLEDIRRIAKSVTQVEPDAELIVMPFVDAEHNFVVTSAGVTVGCGHDGATAGRNATFIPLATDLRGWLDGLCNGGLAGQYGVGDDEDAYLEAVSKKGKVHLTQVRAGPRIGGSRDYVPCSINVERVVEVATDDLLEWERTVQAFANDKGTVVWHPGGSVTSHFGVHCVINKVPYLTTKCPEVGSALTATACDAWQEKDYQTLAEYVRAYERISPDDDEATTLTSWTALAVATLHALASLTSSREDANLRLVAFALSFLPRLFTGLCAGEVRHAPEKLKDYAERLAGNDLRPEMSRNERDAIYGEALCLPLAACGDILGRCYALFATPGWASEYGGSAWADCALASAVFLDELVRFLEDPAEETLKGVLGQFNRVVHLAHNNGWWLNKVMNREAFDVLAEVPCFGLVNPVLLEVLQAPLQQTSCVPLAQGAVATAENYYQEVAYLLQRAPKESVEGWELLTPNIDVPETSAVEMRWTLKGKVLNLQVPLGHTHPARNRPYGVAVAVLPTSPFERAVVALCRQLAEHHDDKREDSSDRTAYGRGRLAKHEGWVAFTLEAKLADERNLRRFVTREGTVRFCVPLSELPDLVPLFEEATCTAAAG